MWNWVLCFHMYLTDLAIMREDKLYFLEMNKLTQNYLEMKQNICKFCPLTTRKLYSISLEFILSIFWFGLDFLNLLMSCYWSVELELYHYK